MKDNKVLEALMNSPRVKSMGLKQESVSDILKIYNNIVIDALLENGHIELSNGMIIEIVKLLDRVHVLRGVSYKSSRRYKLKLTMEDFLYRKIEEYYDQLGEDIL